MKIMLILMSMLCAGYLSAEQSVKAIDQQDPEKMCLDDDGNTSNWRHGGRSLHGGRWHGHGGYGGYGRYGGYGYGGYDGGYGYEAPVEKLPPIIEEVRVPVVKRQEVLQEVIKVVRPEFRTVKVPRTIRKTIVGAPLEAPIIGAPAPVQGDGGQAPPPQGDAGQQGGPQGDAGQQGPPQGGGQMPQGQQGTN